MPELGGRSGATALGTQTSRLLLIAWVVLCGWCEHASAILARCWPESNTPNITCNHTKSIPAELARSRSVSVPTRWFASTWFHVCAFIMPSPAAGAIMCSARLCEHVAGHAAATPGAARVQDGVHGSNLACSGIAGVTTCGGLRP